jgi:hypothetical protein
MSLADGLATALQRYLDAKAEVGLHALLLGGAEPDLSNKPGPKAAAQPSAQPAASKSNGHAPKGEPRNVAQYKLKCPACTGVLAFEEGCVKCYGCGFSQC